MDRNDTAAHVPTVNQVQGRLVGRLLRAREHEPNPPTPTNQIRRLLASPFFHESCGGGKRTISPCVLVYARSPALRPHTIPRETRRPRCAKFMASDTGKKLIQIDVSSDTVCPWCFVGKKNLDKAMEQSKDKFDFEAHWHPFFLNPDAPKEGVRKSDFYKMKFGPVQYERVISRMTEIFRGLGLEYDMSGLTGNTMDSHRLITLAGHQGCDKQNALVEELFLNYFCQGKYIGDKQVLLDAARKVGIEGAEELLEDPTKGVDEVQEELKKYSSGISGVPHFVINNKYQLSGGQPPNVFMRAFEMAAKDGA